MQCVYDYNNVSSHLCKSEEDGNYQLQDELRREVAIMKKLKHRNVVRLIEVIDDPSSQKMYVVQEYVQSNLMDLVLISHYGLSEARARTYTRDLLCGVSYLHFIVIINLKIFLLQMIMLQNWQILEQQE